METAKNRPIVPSFLRPMLLRPATALLLACALPLAMLLFSYAPVIDDAYISYRYAHNLASGQGLVFNPGEHVEGYTNLLWTLIMAMPEALGLPSETFAALAGVTFGVLALIDLWRICRRLGNVTWAATVPVVVFGLYPDFWLTAANGLEGGLFAFLLVRLVYLLSFGRLVYAGLCGGLLFATRPDSVLILPICAFYVLALSENRTLPFRRRLSRRLLPLLAPWLALIAAVTVWRLAYYGAWLPNTIEAKSIPPSALDLVVVAKNAARGVLYWLGFLASALPLTIGAALALAVAGQNRTVRLCTAILTAQVPIVLANGGDWMPHHRLLAVYAPLLAILSGVALDRVAQGGGRTRRVLAPWLTTRRVGLLLASGCALVLLGNPWEATPDVGDGTSERCYGALAAAAQPVLAPTDEVGLEALGTFGYTNPHVYVHDMMGLTNRHVALHGSVYYRAIGKTDPSYTYGTVRPHFILVHSGFNLLSRMVHVSEGEYNDTYSTFSLTSPDLPSCSELPYVVSIRKDSAARILPAFADFELRPVTVPDFDDSRKWAIG